MQFATLAETIFESAIGAVCKYRAGRSEPVDGAFYAPEELAGISHIVAVRFDRGSESKVYVVIYASTRGLSVIDASLLRGIGAGGVAQTARVRQLVTEPRDDLYAAAVEHIRSEVGSVIDVVALGDHFYRVEGTRAAELCYALFTAGGAISGLAFGPTVGLMERRFAAEPFAGAPPLDTAFQVIWGGRRAVDNHHFRSREQRYALDLEPPTECTARVVSIGAGAVTHVEDGHPDSGAAEFNTPGAHFGNHIVVSSGAYEVVYAHLRRSSICVSRGQTLCAGDVLGEVGNSGVSTRPHLHLHVRTQAEHQGVPLAFTIDGGCREFVRGDIVRGHALPAVAIAY